MRRALFVTLLAALLGCSSCASPSQQQPAHFSYGPPPMFPGPDGNAQHVQGMTNWGATDEHFGPATPGPFRGY